MRIVSSTVLYCTKLDTAHDTRDQAMRVRKSTLSWQLGSPGSSTGQDTSTELLKVVNVVRVSVYRVLCVCRVHVYFRVEYFIEAVRESRISRECA